MVTPEAPRTAANGDLRIRPLILVLILIGVLLAVIGVGLDLIIRIGGSQSGLLDGIRNITFPDAEGNLFSWYETFVLAAVAVGFFLIALARRGARDSVWPFVSLGAIALLLSADEAAYLHERLAIFAQELGLSSSFTYQWLLIAVPIAIVVGVFVLWVARRIEPKLRMRLLVAGIVFLAGAVGAEVLAGVIAKVDLGLVGDTKLVIHDIEVFVEETLEIVGAILAFRAVLLHLNISNGPEGLAFSLPEPAPAAKKR